MGWFKGLWRSNRNADALWLLDSVEEQPAWLLEAMHEANKPRKESTMELSAAMQAKIDAVIAYMGTQPLPSNGPDEGVQDLGTVMIWTRDFGDAGGREAWRWSVVEFKATGRTLAVVDFHNPWRINAVAAVNPTT